MSKLDNNIINNLKMLALDLIQAGGSGDVGLSLSSAPIFYSLFKNNIHFNPHDFHYINSDRLVVTNRLLPLLYASFHLFYKDYSLDNLKEYKKYDSNCKGYASLRSLGIQAPSILEGDVVAASVGLTLGERYLESLIKIENPKNNLINFKTICICTEADIMSGSAYEALSFASSEYLNKYLLIVIKDGIGKDSSTKETFNENLVDRFIALNFNVEEINGNNFGSIDGAIDDAMHSKKPTVLIIKNTYGVDSSRKDSNKNYNMPLSNEEMQAMREKYNMTSPFEVKEEYVKELAKDVDKRLSKEIAIWQNLKNESLKDLKIKEIIEFLTNGLREISFKSENIKINSTYEEELIISNNKILNLLTNKSPFILCGSNDNFYYTKSSINKSDIMSKENPTGRNILFGNRTLAMGGISLGLASLGFKLFLSAPLVYENLLHHYIKLSCYNSLPINYIFTQDTILNTYEEMGYPCIEEISDLRSIPNLINFRPCDIDEIVGVYSILSNYHKTTTMVISSNKTPKLLGTNAKYVLAGAYRVRKEREDLNAIIVATGSEVPIALKLADDLSAYGFDFRVISMPASEIYDLQKEKYQNMLLPKEIKTFTLEFAHPNSLQKYATSPLYVLGIDALKDGGSKEELLSHYNLTADALKVKILEIMKNN